MAYGKSKLGGKCVDCGATEKLHFDHKVDNGAILIANLTLASQARFDTELNKCELRCEMCHNTKHKGSARVTHGTLSSYRYCKCDECKAAKAKHNKENYGIAKKIGRFLA
jgi:hypothetical protein